MEATEPRRFTRTLLCTLTLALALPAAGESVPRETIPFQFTHDTHPGESVFVLGDVAELGAGDVTRAVKLVPQWDGQQTHWSAAVAIPQGREFTYQFVLRSDRLEDWSDPQNGTALTQPIDGATTPPDPAQRPLALFALAAEDPRVVTFETPAGPVDVPFQPVPGRDDLLYALLPDQPNGRGTTATLLGEPIDTPLHATLRRYGPIYNYDPDPAALPFGRIHEHALPTDAVPHTRTVDGVTGRGFQVYAPRGYDDQTDRRYPVLYMHDGQNCFEAGGPYGSWQAEQVAHDLIQRGVLREIIIVAVDNSSERFAEYVPEFGNSIVTNDDYNRFLVDELKPWIDANYRTLTGPADTGVIGSSLGGVASLVLGLEHGDTFGLVGAMSPSLWAGGTDARVANGELPDSVRLYLDAGDVNDGGAATAALRDSLLAQGRILHDDLFFQIGYGHGHNEAAWRARLPDFLAYQFPVTGETNELPLLLACPGDLDSDGVTGQSDLAILLSVYETGDAGDVDGDADTDQSDLGLLLANYACVNPALP
jgi:predicted alpha/beta superfamily hydrolase